MPRRKKQYSTLPGMIDILPEEAPIWLKLEEIVSSVANFYNFSRITTPLLEEEELFIKGTGQDTEIIEKQMYSFRTKGGKRVVLRPEFTPSIVRAYIQNGMGSLIKPVKLWSFGPVFRHERPQKGRYRQFWQFNLEVFGEKSPIQDALLIQLFSDILRDLSLTKWIVEVNSIGCDECRSSYLRQLRTYYRAHRRKLCPRCEKRLKESPLRLLDCKEEKCQRVKKLAPQIVNSLCTDCHKHFKTVLEILDITQIPYMLNPYLVRGLDYYTRTVFEFVPEGKENQDQSTLIGGGRYDKLIDQLGGQETPAIGGAGGVRRIVEEIQENRINILNIKVERFDQRPKVFLCQIGELAKRKSLLLIELFRKNKIKIGENLSKDNLRFQLGQAAKLDVQYALIFGQKESLEETMILRNMETGIQKVVPLKNIIKKIKTKLK